MAMKTSVSLYSYQEAYYIGKLDLEGCVREAAKAGAKGIELIAEQMPVGGSYPDVSDKAAAQWVEWMQKYSVTPTCMDTFTDIMMFKGRFLTRREQIQLFERDIKLANKLGFFSIRVIHNIQPDVLECVLPIAEYYNIKMCFEIHSPMKIRSAFIKAHIDMIERTGTKNYGFMPDFGIFTKSTTPRSIEQALREGISERVIDFVNKQKQKGPMRMNEMFGLKEAMGISDNEMMYVFESLPNEMDAPNDPEWLKDMAPYIYHVHAKCLDINEDCIDPKIDNEAAIKMLREIGYDGYLSTEYEGQRGTHGQDCPVVDDEVEKVRRHQIMLKKLIAGV